MHNNTTLNNCLAILILFFQILRSVCIQPDALPDTSLQDYTFVADGRERIRY
jgi:hypothetical protein